MASQLRFVVLLIWTCILAIVMPARTPNPLLDKQGGAKGFGGNPRTTPKSSLKAPKYESGRGKSGRFHPYRRRRYAGNRDSRPTTPPPTVRQTIPGSILKWPDAGGARGGEKERGKKVSWNRYYDEYNIERRGKQRPVPRRHRTVRAGRDQRMAYERQIREPHRGDGNHRLKRRAKAGHSRSRDGGGKKSRKHKHKKRRRGEKRRRGKKRRRGGKRRHGHGHGHRSSHHRKDSEPAEQKGRRRNESRKSKKRKKSRHRGSHNRGESKPAEEMETKPKSILKRPPGDDVGGVKGSGKYVQFNPVVGSTEIPRLTENERMVNHLFNKIEKAKIKALRKEQRRTGH